jgi:hypothetical protein
VVSSLWIEGGSTKGTGVTGSCSLGLARRLGMKVVVPRCYG